MAVAAIRRPASGHLSDRQPDTPASRRDCFTSRTRISRSCLTGCRWRGRRATQDSRCMSQPASTGAPTRNRGRRLHPASDPVPARRLVAVCRDPDDPGSAADRPSKIEPQITHHSGLQCCVYGSIAALGKKFSQVSALTGLGVTSLRRRRGAARLLRSRAWRGCCPGS